ncbi:hypothetical protein DSO57_1033715 [Entomophthora muscae]|uniref:Uncharacterized protein n=1 Tax=Entomophthora muscae TaxID=34485 RepID=A0ACC2SCP6_9FUNG|nr:hypothetical protein DSO57_1033715 [Entomophthora muscae]
MVSWWILPPGWEPNLVSLAPLSYSRKREITVHSSQETPLVDYPSLSQRCAKARDIEHKRIEGGIKHLEARYAVGDPIYALNPNLAKLEPNYLGPFKMAAVYDNHTYQFEDAQGNTKRLHHNCLHPCLATPTQKLFVQTFPDLLKTLILVSYDKQGARGCCN